MRLVYLDAIRAILSIIVLLYHWGLVKLIARFAPGLTGGAWGLAVDYFFLLSGFVLSLSLSRRDTGIIRFLAVRAFRLLPVAVAALALSLFVGAFLTPPSYATLSEVFANLLLVQSFVSERSIPGTMWSASFEMWLPCLFCLFSNFRILSSRLIAFLLIAFLIFQGWIDSSPLVEAAAGWGAFFRAVSGLGSGFLLGNLFLGLGGLLSLYPPRRYLWGGGFFFVAAIGSILLAPDFRFAGFVFPFFAALSIFLLSVAERGSGCLFPSAARGIVEFFATRSYSIYLIHLPLISLSSCFFGANLYGNAPLKIGLICVTVILCDSVYRYVEVPGYRLRKRFRILA